jgi:c-di-GMP-binding flagellar brake protein YcgR
LPDAKHSDAKTITLSSVLDGTPFPLSKSQGRKYIRIELSAPVHFRILTCTKGKIKLSRDQVSGRILNLSEGGMLLLTRTIMPEEGFVLLTLNLNKLVILEGVLGKIKRVEPSEEGDFLVGIEFAPREQLESLVSSQEIARLPYKVGSFDRKLRQIISSYLRSAELAT